MCVSFVLIQLFGCNMKYTNCHLNHTGYRPARLLFVCSADERFISFEEAASVLRDELSYPEDRAAHFVQTFDRNGDGRLSVAEFTQFRKKIEESSVVDSFIRNTASLRVLLKYSHALPACPRSTCTLC